MKSFIAVIFVAIAALAFFSCGGGGEEKSVSLVADYPAELSAFADRLAARGYLESSEGSVFSAPSRGIADGDTWEFDLEPLSGVEQTGSFFRVDFVISSSEFSHSGEEDYELVLCSVSIPFSSNDLLTAPPKEYDCTMDDDADGLPNIMELIAGVDPMLADTDGDGRLDGEDMFPSVATEWMDADGDGIGDNEDDDSDGDGISNEDELILGTDPRLFDSDGDGVGDGDDNCPLVGNADQKDADGDGRGDACDDDTDGDGLSDDVEKGIGSDHLNPDTDSDGLGDGLERKMGSDPLKSDTDGDEIGDKTDNCPLAVNIDQSDVDGDGVGDICDKDVDGDSIENNRDNCPVLANFFQDDTDGDGTGDACDDDIDADGIPNPADNCPLKNNPAQISVDADADGVAIECDLDDGDPKVFSDDRGIFVDVARGSDSNAGDRRRPFASIERAISVASGKNLPIYVAAGIYDASRIVFPDGVSLHGGFLSDDAEAFSSRDFRSLESKYRTAISRQDLPVTVAISASDVWLGGFHFENASNIFDHLKPSSTILVRGGSVTVDRSRVSGNPSSPDDLTVFSSGGDLRISKSIIDAGGIDAPGAGGCAIKSEGGTLSVQNSVIQSRNARFACGIDSSAGQTLIAHNTILSHGSNPDSGFAKGVIARGDHVSIVNNILVAASAPDRYPLICSGSPGKGVVAGNVIADFSALSFSEVIGCDGLIYSDPDFDFCGADVFGNTIFDGESESSLVASDFSPLSGAIDSGVDPLQAGISSIHDDLNSSPRPSGGGYDSGAIEK